MIQQTSKPPPRINSEFFIEAILLVRSHSEIHLKQDFCEAVFLRGPDYLMEIRALLDDYCDVDHLNLSAHCINKEHLDQLLSNLDQGLLVERLTRFEEMTIEIGEFYGEYNNLVDIASVTIRSHGGRQVVLKPDPDRWIADQFMIVR
ncbi:hypothetical protein QTN93_03180 [Sphingomonas aerolata]|uniref:hypothetical protein n=1 Tax=Sphingomonas aerolata TaxID=185951 RepID=UPI0035A65296